ncbi:MAG: 4'-phosphopantetheinyl transferase superfamily protein [Chthoniobacteraceae bacterium]
MLTTGSDFQLAAVHPGLRPAEVHLWLVRLDAFDPACEATLTHEEWLRAGRFHHAIDRHRYIAARGTLRAILGDYSGIEAGDLRFAKGPRGKPSLPDSLLRFNLSHSEDLMLVAVTHGREVGVDLEAVRGNIPFEMLAEHYFCAEDQWALRVAPAEERLGKFFALWTRTEAQLKARGLGVGDEPSFPDADRFTLHTFEPADNYAAALVVEGCDFELSCWQWPS